ncbi:DEAD/DEAH box helicase domain protein (fragment) [Candidatus Competibacter denitrificans Run_A_D11]|uniref:DEAD/DEAH box helicase domain protein n=2 Tax=Candidatus Competibacter TaxID=221279 RepID=W6MD75_9GAMM
MVRGAECRLKRKLLGMRGDHGADGEADDRTAGHPLRRFAEFGILPGYEFPNEPCTLRLRNDPHEEDPIALERRFGIAQYQPNASVHARGHRWRVVGLDNASPWNPQSPHPDWVYVRCGDCDLCYAVQQHGYCPRCRSTTIPVNDQRGLPGHEFGGFIAIRDDTPVLEEEDRYALAALVSCHPQWNGRCIHRFRLSTGWNAELREEEEIRWLNEWKPASAAEREAGAPQLHENAHGFYLCPVCGRDLKMPEDQNASQRGGRSRSRQTEQNDPYGHTRECLQRGQPPQVLAITARLLATTLRLIVTLPPDWEAEDYQRWGYSLGYALRTGMRHLFMLDGSELEFELEPMWKIREPAPHWKGMLTFIDTAVGGSGFLERAAAQFHQVAAQAMDHLDHVDCESACYRCLKSYNNQRHHQHLQWPLILPDLEHLSQSAPVTLETEKSVQDDPKPWLEAYAAGVSSPLELKFLRQFEQYGLPVDKQVPVAANAGEHPISVADFVVVYLI